MMKTRYLFDHIKNDLKSGMVFLGGPRQVGKTTLSKLIGDSFKNYSYFNWDNRNMRKEIREGKWPSASKLIILDEIHKFSKWKSFVKGEYDANKEKTTFMVTGSARLNVYKKGGDSLLGRYHYYRLHPFSYAELLDFRFEQVPFEELKFSENSGAKSNMLENLITYGGFPSPFLGSNQKTLRRWHNERKELLLKEDIRDLTMVKDISSVDLLSDILPNKVGSQLSINSIRQDLEVTHKSVVNWLEIFEMLYYSYRIYPWQSKKINALKKESKLYLWDWSEVEKSSARLENLVASHLLKFCHYMHDALGYNVDLFYIRDLEKREVDFLVSYKNKPWFSVEVKESDNKIDKAIKYFKEKIKIPFCYQVVKNFSGDYTRDGVRVLSLDKFLSALF